jgi:hypothetical protein
MQPLWRLRGTDYRYLKVMKTEPDSINDHKNVLLEAFAKTLKNLKI